jgi:hypothetical protein
MARPDYDLNTIRETDLVSSNGTEYEINILWTGAGAGTEMILGSSGVQISYETPNDKTKNSYILSSQCTIPFLVQNATDKTFILELATEYQEKDVWITVRETTGTDKLLWCGYVLLDLKDEQDISYPYEVTLTAVDGLAGLKEVPFVRETNTESGAVPKFPYVRTDTFMNAGYQQIIGAGTTYRWLAELLLNTGMVLADDGIGAAASILENYLIQTAVNSYNEGHPAPASGVDPLAYSRISMESLYIKKEDNVVDVPSCYDVLELLCKNFGMRCVYWEHSFYFIEMDQYNQDSAAASTPSVPLNIPTREYYYNGGFRLNQNYVGNVHLSIYDLTIENVTAPGEGLQKLAGNIYSGLPAIKTVNGTYLSTVSPNGYSGFPLLPPHYGTAWDTSGNETILLTWLGGYVPSNVVYTTIENFKDADGMFFESYLSYSNTTTADLEIYNLFMIVAKPSSQAHDFPFKVCARNVGSVDYAWQDWTSGGIPFYGTNALKRYARNKITVPPAATIDQNVGILAYSTSTDPYCTTHNGLFPKHSDFSGSWDFSVITFMCYDSNSAQPMRGFDGSLGAENYGASYNHGACSNFSSGTATNYAGTALSTVGQNQDIWDYAYDYNNTFDANSSNQYLGTMQAISSSAGVSYPTLIEVDVVNKNSFIYESGNYFWGDGSTIQVSDDGSTWVNADVDGKWVKPTYVWNAGTSQFDYTVGTYNKKLVTLVLENIIYNQSISLKQFNGTTALSSTDRYYSGTVILKYMNPIAKLTDADDNQYQLMRGTFNLLMDEWSTTMNQVFYEVPSETINIGEETLRDKYLSSDTS